MDGTVDCELYSLVSSVSMMEVVAGASQSCRTAAPAHGIWRLWSERIGPLGSGKSFNKVSVERRYGQKLMRV